MICRAALLCLMVVGQTATSTRAPAITDFELRTDLERALYEAGVAWEGRAMEAESLVTACMSRLRARTSSVSCVKLDPLPPPEPSPLGGWGTHVAVGSAFLALGLVLGAFLPR